MWLGLRACRRTAFDFPCNRSAELFLESFPAGELKEPLLCSPNTAWEESVVNIGIITMRLHWYTRFDQ